MQLENVIGGKYYIAYYHGENHPTVIKALNDGSFRNSAGIYTRFRETSYRFSNQNTFNCDLNIRLATPQEIHWLDCCINNNQFVEFDEAMLTFLTNTKDDPELNQILIKLLTE